MNKIIQSTILITIVFLNTGCLFNFFDDEPEKQTVQSPTITEPITTTATPTAQISAPIVVTPSMPVIAPECTDDPTRVNSCSKAPIDTTELQPKIITSSGGEVHNLKSYRGKKLTITERSNGYLFQELGDKIVILEMFGKDCPHCIKEMPIMNRLRKKYRNRLEIIAFQVEGQMSTRQAKSLIKRYNIKYPLVDGTTATNLQYNIQSTYGWTGILPFIMVIKDGVTEFTYRGEVSYRELNRDIRSII